MKTKNIFYWSLISVCLLLVSLNFIIIAQTEVIESVRIGVISPSTLDLETWIPIVEMAESDINQYMVKNRHYYHFEFLLDNADYQWVIHLEKIQSFKSMGVNLIIGGAWDSQASSALSYVNENNMLLLSPSSTSPTLRIADDNLYRICPDTTVQASIIAKMLWSHDIKAIVIFQRGDSWADGIYDTLSQEYLALGGVIGERIRYASEVTDFSSYLAQAESKATELVALYGTEHVAVELICFGEDCSLLLTLVENYSTLWNLKWFGTDKTASNKIILDNVSYHANHIKLYSLLGSQPETTISLELKSRLETETGRIFGFYQATLYDACWIYALSVITADSTNITNIKSVLLNVSSTYYGASGLCVLNEAGDRLVVNFDIWGYGYDDSIPNFVKLGYYNYNKDQFSWRISDVLVGTKIFAYLVFPSNKARVNKKNLIAFVKDEFDQPVLTSTVNFYVDGSYVGSNISSDFGYAYFTYDKIGLHEWYVEATKSGYESDTSPTWSYYLREAYRLKIVSEYGVPSGSGLYDKGATAVFQVQDVIESGSKTRHFFLGWESESLGGYTGQNNPANVIIDNDIIEIALWKTQYYLKLVATPGGSVRQASGWFDKGSKIQFSAVPDEGYRFVKWLGFGTGSYSGNNANYEITLEEPISEIAVFEEDLDHQIIKENHIIKVPENFPSIQEAVDAANSFDIIEVNSSNIKEGYSKVKIDKPITLKEKDAYPRFLNWEILANNVTIDGFISRTYGSYIFIYNSMYSTIKNMALLDFGILNINNSTNIELINNYIENGYGIQISDSYNIKMHKNKFINSKFSIEGKNLTHYIHDIDNSNTINDKSIYYFKNIENILIDPIKYPNSDHLILVNISNVILNNFNLTHNNGLLIFYSKGVCIENSYGPISLLFSKEVTVKNNSHASASIKGCSNVTIEDNDIFGPSIENSFNIKIYNNRIKYSWKMEIISSNNINIVKNNFTSYDNKISYIMITQSKNGTVEQNNFIEKKIKINNSTQWRFYCNNFYNSTPYYDEGYFSHAVRFDNGYPMGNYWNTYDGTDDFSGPALTSIGEDGIGDTPFEIYSRRDEDSWFDYYPLMNPIPDIGPATHPVIQSVTSSIIKPRSYEEVNITASILSYRDIDKIILSYSDGISWHNISMSSINGNYIGIIQKQENGTVVQYKIYVMDYMGNYAVSQLFNYTVKDKTPLKIETVNWTPIEPKPDEYVEVETRIVSKDENISVSKIILSFKDAASKWWNTTAEYHEPEDIWIAQIPKQPEKTDVQFYLTAIDNEGEHIKSEFYKYEVISYTDMETFQKFIVTPIGLLSIGSIILALILVIILIKKNKEK